MAKNSIRDYDSSSSNNSDVQSVDISEGCSPSGINNAIREVMADLADVNEGTIALESPKFDSIKDGNIKPPDASGTDVAGTATTIKGGAGTGTGAGGSIIFQTADGGSTGSSVNAHATAMTITDDGNINFTGSIKDSAGTNTALTIDSTGRVLQPEKPAFFAYMDSSAAEGFTGTIVCNATRYNKGGHYSTTTGKFTAPVAGVYQFNFVSFGCENASGNQLAANTAIFVDLHHDTDGIDLARVYHLNTSSAGYPNLNINHAVYLDANDEVKIQVNARYIYSDSSDLYITFSGFLVG